MAVVIKEYRKYTCVKCNQTAKTERVYEGLTLGNPLYQCEKCGALNYDKFIFEPALLNPQLLIKDEKKKYNTALLLLYMPLGFFTFFMISLAFENFGIGFAIVSIPLALLTALILKKKKNLTSDRFSDQISESMARLNANIQYAALVFELQGVHPDSFWAKNHYN